MATARLSSRAWLAGLAVVVLAGVLMFVHRRHVEARLLRADPDGVPADVALDRFAVSRGAPIYRARCASCHGAEARGDAARGVPNLTDADWLYGTGQVSDIERVVSYGIRAHNPKTWNMAVMPALASPNPGGEKGLQPLSPGDIGDVVEFIEQAGHHPYDPAAAARGYAIYSTRGACYDCHGSDAQGDAAIGAPNLTDDVWLYGDGSRASIFRSIAHGHQGVCPAWFKVLRPAAIREVALYVYSLSHGRPPAKAPKLKAP